MNGCTYIIQTQIVFVSPRFAKAICLRGIYIQRRINTFRPHSLQPGEEKLKIFHQKKELLFQRSPATKKESERPLHARGRERQGLVSVRPEKLKLGVFLNKRALFIVGGRPVKMYFVKTGNDHHRGPL